MILSLINLVFSVSTLALTQGSRRYKDQTVVLLGIGALLLLATIPIIGEEILGKTGEKTVFNH